ncbi:aldolase [Metabacillus idriensis]|uniref:aldolase n=1 Tax=Metabacillus idriensis TaxID=324768 RepID=UPI00174D8F70|nr:aldolase [Metabacillus idriensis]
MRKVTRYLAFGYKINSQIEFNELPFLVGDRKYPELDILLVDLKNELSNFKNNGEVEFQINKDKVSFLVPKIALFSIDSANIIKVYILNEQRMDVVKLFTLGTCIGILLLQRNILPLHGSAIEIHGNAYAFIGHSGAGKSTLASAFIQKGYKLISDDVIPVTVDSSNQPVVIPAYPQQKLWKESLEEFQIDSTQFKPLFERETKFVIPVTDHFSTKEIPLVGVFELTKTSENDAVEITSISKLQSLRTLYFHTYRNFLLNDMRLIEWHFKFTANILEKIFVNKISRPISRFTTDELVLQILKSVTKEEKEVANT